MRKRSIGLVLASIPQYSETFLNNKIRGLQESGFDVTVITGSRSKENLFYKHISNYPDSGPAFAIYLPWVAVMILFTAIRPSLKFYRLERKNGASVISALKKIYLNAHLLSRNFDWLHYGFSSLAIDREFVASSINAKMGSSFRGFDISIYPLKHPGCYNKLWKTADRIHTISDDLYQQALQLGLSPEVPVQKIVPAIDFAKFPFNEKAIEFGSTIHILTVGRLHWKKGMIYALHAIRKLIDKNISVHYTIVGTGSQYEEIMFAIHQLGLGEHVTITGKLEHSTVIEQYSKTNIYLQPSIQEGFCNAVLEAQASGLLCIVSNAEGLSENVLDKVTGWVVPKRDAAILSAKIEEVISLSTEERREITLRARKRIEEDFNIQKQNAGFREFFNS